MRRELRLVLVLCLAGVWLASGASAAPPAYQSLVLSRSPLLYYQLNETSGNAINKGSLGSDFDMVYNGTPTRGAATAQGDAGVAFDEAADYLESLSPSPASLSGNPTFTAEAVFFVPNGGGATTWAPFLHWGDGSAGDPTMLETYFSFSNNDADEAYAGFYNGGLQTVASVPLGQWHHFVWVREGGGAANVGSTIYVDGVAVATENDPDLPCDACTPNVNSAAFRINRARNLTRFFTGTLDEVALYPTALTAQEVAAQYEALVTPIPPPSVDVFLCYKAKTTKGTPAFESRDVTLADAFETRETEVIKPVALCNPADQGGAGIADPATHLESYQIKSSEKHEKRTRVAIQNGFGGLLLDTVKEDRLLVPSGKSLEGPAQAPVDPAIDHLKCYKAKVSPGTSKFPKGMQVSLADQFDGTQRTFALSKPRHLCLPVDKNAEGIQHADQIFVCYGAKPAKGQAKHVKRTGVSTANQFGSEELDTVKEDELCVPSSLVGG